MPKLYVNGAELAPKITLNLPNINRRFMLLIKIYVLICSLLLHGCWEGNLGWKYNKIHINSAIC